LKSQITSSNLFSPGEKAEKRGSLKNKVEESAIDLPDAMA
jgi:hypothetical protein